MFPTITQTMTMTIIPVYMNVKNLLLKVKEWLRRRVAALRSEEVNDTRGVYVDDNVNDDENVVGANLNFQFSIFNSKSHCQGVNANHYIAYRC